MVCASATLSTSKGLPLMRTEFNFDRIQSVEFCVNLAGSDGERSNYLVPADRSVQEALRQVLAATAAAIEPEDGNWPTFELSEKYASRETLRAALAAEEMAAVRALHTEEGWPTNVGALANPARLAYYFGVFRDDRNRKLLGVRKATQFKGAFRGRFVSVIDDTLRMVTDKVFKLDNEFDFLISAQHVYVLHPAAFEHIAEIESYAADRAKEKALALGETVTFLDFTGLAKYVEVHRRAARLVAALSGRNDLGTITKAMFTKAAAETDVILERSGRKLAPARGSEVGCLELLDHRRYTTALRPGQEPAFIASSRRPVGR